MPPVQLSIKNAVVDAKIESVVNIEATHPDIQKLLSLVSSVNAVVPLTRFRTHQTDAGPPAIYEYEISALDGRVWSQLIKINSGVVSMTFDVPDYWSLNEFLPHRPLRELVQSMLLSSYGVTLIDIKY